MESVGGSIDPANARFSPLELKTGALAARARSRSRSTPAPPPRSTTRSATPSSSRRSASRHDYEISGTVSFGGVDSLGFASIAAWDIETAQTLLHREGRFDGISIAGEAGHLGRRSCCAPSSRCSPPRCRSRTAPRQAKDDAAELDSSMGMIRMFLLGFGGIALLVGAFVIFNTLSITVAQRTREFATLRTLGASRKQVMRSVVLEGLVIGLLASVIGLLFGLGIAKGMVALFSALGVELPEGLDGDRSRGRSSSRCCSAP